MSCSLYFVGKFFAQFTAQLLYRKALIEDLFMHQKPLAGPLVQGGKMSQAKIDINDSQLQSLTNPNEKPLTFKTDPKLRATKDEFKSIYDSISKAFELKSLANDNKNSCAAESRVESVRGHSVGIEHVRPIINTILRRKRFKIGSSCKLVCS